LGFCGCQWTIWQPCGRWMVLSGKGTTSKHPSIWLNPKPSCSYGKHNTLRYYMVLLSIWSANRLDIAYIMYST
jgi:hypothetical protein